jgi:SulP family sulfate permease
MTNTLTLPLRKTDYHKLAPPRLNSDSPRIFPQTSPTSNKSHTPGWLIAYALREKLLVDGYTVSDFKSDVLSGFVVGMVAIPLGMALGIATGVPPQQGLYTVIVAGFFSAVLGGSKFQVSGPTAAFVVILEPIVVQHGLAGLLTAGLMSGFLIVAMGIFGMGKLIHYMPDTVKYGFTAGIAVTIGAQQIKDFLGVSIPATATHFVDIIVNVVDVLPTMSVQSFLIASATLAIIIVYPRYGGTRVPAPLLAVGFMTLLIFIIEDIVPSFNVATIGSRFSFALSPTETGHGIPPDPPSWSLPWKLSGDTFSLSFGTLYDLIPSAIRIALLGSIESLLSAVIADGMADQLNASSLKKISSPHDPDSELIGIGIANIICPFFGGIPATGAIARTATNIRFGATSPVSAMVHSLFALLCVVLFAPVMSHVPMSSLAALLLFVAFNMAEPHHFMKLLRTSPRDDKIVLMSCFTLTVCFDMIIGVGCGLVVAAVLFAKQMTSAVSRKRDSLIWTLSTSCLDPRFLSTK